MSLKLCLKVTPPRRRTPAHECALCSLQTPDAARPPHKDAARAGQSRACTKTLYTVQAHQMVASANNVKQFTQIASFQLAASQLQALTVTVMGNSLAKGCLRTPLLSGLCVIFLKGKKNSKLLGACLLYVCIYYFSILGLTPGPSLGCTPGLSVFILRQSLHKFLNCLLWTPNCCLPASASQYAEITVMHRYVQLKYGFLPINIHTLPTFAQDVGEE